MYCRLEFMNFLQFTPALLGSISFYLAVYHLIVYIRLKEPALHPRVHLWFAVICFFTGIGDFLCTALYLSTSIQEGVVWQWWQFLNNQMFPILFIWFLYEYIGAPRKRIIRIVTIGLFAFFCLSVIAPLEWSFRVGSPAIKEMIFAPNFVLTYYEVEAGILYFILNLIYFVLGIYLLYFVIQYYLQHRKQARLFLAAFLIYFYCGINDMLVVEGVYTGIYLAEYGYIALIILMTFSLFNSYVDTLTKLYVDASDISKLKSNMIMFATHELKTPLIPIMGWVEFLKSGITDGKDLREIIGQTEIDSMLNATQRLNRIIEEFLDLGRIEGGRLVLNKEHCRFQDLVFNAINAVTYFANSCGISIHNQIRDTEIYCDKMRIEQVFINILFNAIKFSPAGSTIEITCENTDRSTSISFQDHGSGFSPEDIKNIWRPFSSGIQSKHGTNVPSTGVGLFLSKAIVEMHAGSIRIESPGLEQGSNVTIILPLT